MNKDRQIVSELRNFFTESGCGLGIQRIMNVLGTINITERQMARVQVLVGPWKMPMQGLRITDCFNITKHVAIQLTCCHMSRGSNRTRP